jgi:hypothetical protein
MSQQSADQAVHEAAQAGLPHKVAEMLAMDPSLIDAKGMDARTPLHCAGTVAVAALLLDHGARIDARDEDHDSTPAQWRIGEAPDVTRFLLDRGARPDIFLAAALGDVALAQRLVAEDLGCLAHRIGKPPEFPPVGHQGRGGTIYQWTLRFNSYPQQIALMKGHQAMFDFLYAASDTADPVVGELRVGAAAGSGGDREGASGDRTRAAGFGSRARCQVLLGDEHEFRRGEANARSGISGRASGAQPWLHAVAQCCVGGFG